MDKTQTAEDAEDQSFVATGFGTSQVFSKSAGDTAPRGVGPPAVAQQQRVAPGPEPQGAQGLSPTAGDTASPGVGPPADMQLQLHASWDWVGKAAIIRPQVFDSPAAELRRLDAGMVGAACIPDEVTCKAEALRGPSSAGFGMPWLALAT